MKKKMIHYLIPAVYRMVQAKKSVIFPLILCMKKLCHLMNIKKTFWKKFNNSSSFKKMMLALVTMFIIAIQKMQRYPLFQILIFVMMMVMMENSL